MRSEKKELTRQRMVKAAAEGFRSHGYGVGVDGLAKRAGVTSGAFYVHFGSKAEAFRQSVGHGLDDLLGGIHFFQQEHHDQWWPKFVNFYLGAKRTCDLTQSCSLQTLTPELARSDEATRQVFEDRFLSIAQSIVAGPVSPGKPETTGAALSALATLIGAVTLARAVKRDEIAEQIAQAAAQQLL